MTRATRVLLLMLLALVPAPALGLPEDADAWVITSDVTVEDAPLALATDVVIMPGGALRLKGVDALVASAPAARVLNITVRAGGTLELLDGTTLLAAAPFDIYVEAGATLRAEDATLTRAHLHLASSGATLDATTIASGLVRVLANEPRITGGALDGSTSLLLDVLGGNVTVEDGTRFDHAGGAAVLVRAGAAARLANVSIGQTADYGVRVEGGTARIENATFDLSASYSLYGLDAHITLLDSAFRAHCGAFLVGGTRGLVARNDFGTLDHGLTLFDTGVMEVRHNTFHGTQLALLVADATPLVRDNAFLGNALDVQQVGDDTLDARWNWWGSAAGPGAGATAGDVDVAPWLGTAS